MLWKSLLSTAAALVFFPLLLWGEVTERIVALVNEEVITLSELEETARPVYEEVKRDFPPSEQAARLKKVREDILSHLIESKLLDQEIKRKKVDISDREVETAIQDILKSSNLTENELKKVLAREGMTFSAYRQKMREEIGKIRLVNREIKSKIVIEEEVLRKAYQANLEKYTIPLEMKFQQIFFPRPANGDPARLEAVRREALQVLEKARQGEDFGELAKKYSQAPDAPEGGILGFFKRHELMPELDEAGFKLKAGEISDLISSPIGFHLLKVLERKGGVARPFEEVQAKLREELIQKEAEKKYSQWMQDLRSRAYIEIRL